MGSSRFIFVVVKQENDIALIHIVPSDSLLECSLIVSTGCAGYPSIQYMIDSVDKENKINKILKFIDELNVKSIILSATNDVGSKIALLIFANLCKKLNIYTISITPKPLPLQGKSALNKHNSILDLINTDEVYGSLILDGVKYIEEAKAKELSLPQLIKVYQDEHDNFALEKYNSLLK